MLKFINILAIFLFTTTSLFSQTDSLNIYWDANTEPDMKEYRLFRSVNSTSNFQQVQTIPHPQTHTVDRSAINPGNYYRYKMVAVDTENNVSDFSETVGVALPTINWSVSEIKSGETTSLALANIVSDLDDDLSELQIEANNRSNIQASISGGNIELNPDPSDFTGTARFDLKVTDPEGFWDVQTVQLNVVQEIVPVFTLDFPSIRFNENEQFTLWLDTCVTVSPYSPGDISWSFSGMNFVSVDYNPDNRRVTFNPAAGWSGNENIVATATTPDQVSKSATLTVRVLPEGTPPEEDSEEPEIPEIIVYPNPYRSSQGHEYVVFDKLPETTAAISIFSSTGDLVFDMEFETAPFSRWHWQPQNNNNQALASGFYIYVVKGEGGEKLKSGTIALIR